MEKVTTLDRFHIFKLYWQLTKPGIIMGNLVTAFGGFILASKGRVQLPLFLITLLGLSFVIAAACVCNNFIDRDIDKKMIRTRNRPLPREVIPVHNAIAFALVLGVVGVLTMVLFTNLLATLLALMGFLIYVIFYSFSKFQTPLCTVIGSVSGSMPPVIGYCAVSGTFNLEAFLFFGTVVMWQMPHFYAIALYRLRDYSNASIPVMPVSKGILATKIRMLVYVIGFVIVSSLLTYYKFTGIVYLVATLATGLVWLYYSIQGFFVKNDTKWARKMFLFSLVVIMSICIVIPFSTL